MTLALFELAPTVPCVLLGCSDPAPYPGAPCPGCTELFTAEPGGWGIRATAAPAMTAAQLADRDAETRAAQAIANGPERKANQLCWLCEERRTCTRTSMGWECTTCTAIA